MSSFKRIVFLMVGSISLGLGIIGVFVPILPTTPFLLLASFLYLNSSERLYRWLIEHPILGEYLYSYITYKGVSGKTKIGALIFLWTSLIITMILADSIVLKLLLVAVGSAVTLHIVLLKTLSREEVRKLDEIYGRYPSMRTVQEKD